MIAGPRRTRGLGVGWSTAACAVLLWVEAAHSASRLDQCRADVASGTLELMRVLDRSAASCLRSPERCTPFSGRGGDPLEPLELALRGIDSACVAAVVVDGVPLSALAPEPCRASWSSCATRVPDLESLEDVLSCHRCMNTGRTAKIDYDLQFPAPAGISSDDRHCLARAYQAMGRATEAGMAEAIDCARAEEDPPRSCTTVPVPGGRYDKALGRISKRVNSCERSIASRASGMTTLCHRAVVSTSDFAACLRQVTACRVCSAINGALGLDQDCASQSGDRQCEANLRADFGRPLPGNILVTNRGDDSVTTYHPDLQFLFGTLEDSTSPVGREPVDVVVHGALALAYVVNSADSSVTILDSGTGAPAFGSLVASTIPVGLQPRAAAVHPTRDILYVANEGDGTVTFLDAWDGGYVYGDLNASTFSSGTGAASVAVHPTGDILYVANAADNTVTFLDAIDGKPHFGTLAASTFPVGDAPQDIFLAWQPERLLVTSQGDASVTTLDAFTGAPFYGTLAASTRYVGGGALATIETTARYGGETGEFSALREGAGVAGFASPAFETSLGPITSDSLEASGAVSSIAVAARGSLAVTLEDRDLVATVRVLDDEALLGKTAAEDASVPLPGAGGLDLAVDPASGRYLLPWRGGAYAALDTSSSSYEVRGTGAGSLVAYHASADIVYVKTAYADRIVAYRGATGEFLNGSPEASTLTTDCGGFGSLVVDENIGVLYARCRTQVLYIDALTMGYLHGSAAASRLVLPLGMSTSDLVADGAHDRLYLDVVEDTFPVRATAVFVLDAETPAFANGSLAASRILQANGGFGLALDAAAGLLYRGVNDGSVNIYDTDGDLLHVGAQLPGPSRGLFLTVDAASGILYASRNSVSRNGIVPSVDDVVYLRAGDATFVGTNLEDSSVILGKSEGISRVAVSVSSGTVAVVRDTFPDVSLVVLDRLQPAALGQRSLLGDTAPTGSSPSALAVIPRVP